VADGQPFVIPTVYVRIDDRLYVHGAAAGRMLTTAGSGIPLCVTVTLLDGLVLARSAFKHSVNYRSVVVLGTATEVAEPDAKLRVMTTLVDRVVAGRSAEIRLPSATELTATRVLELPLVEASVKIRTGPPVDGEADLGRECWAGVIPLALTPLAPVADTGVPPGAVPPGRNRLARVSAA
jgi:hypothetical protein